MKREEVKNKIPGITDEQLDWLMGENGRDVTAEKTKFIKEAITQGVSQYGMQTFDQSLYSHYQQGLITFDEALKWCTNPDEFKLRKIGLQSTKEMSLEEIIEYVRVAALLCHDTFTRQQPTAPEVRKPTLH